MLPDGKRYRCRERFSGVLVVTSFVSKKWSACGRSRRILYESTLSRGGLAFWLLGVQRLDKNSHLTLLPEKNSIGRQAIWLVRSHYRGGESRGRVDTDGKRGIPKKRAPERLLSKRAAVIGLSI